jgi:hypothetical protein
MNDKVTLRIKPKKIKMVSDKKLSSWENPRHWQTSYCRCGSQLVISTTPWMVSIKISTQK